MPRKGVQRALNGSGSFAMLAVAAGAVCWLAHLRKDVAEPDKIQTGFNSFRSAL
jgi:hypothetical protein